MTSYTELSTLASCEKKWEYRYTGPKVDTPPSPAMVKGTLLHGGTNSFWREGTYIVGLEEAWGEVATQYDPSPYFEAYADAEWLLERYSRVYGDLTRNAEVESVEKELTARLPCGEKLKGYVDRFIIINGQRWLVETKSMADWSRLDLMTVDPQLTLYYWLAQENGLEPYGILFDAIRTYRWKPEKPTQAQVLETAPEHILALKKTEQREWARAAVELHPGVERPDGESFQQLWIDRTPEQVETALGWAGAVLGRRDALTSYARPIRNIGPFCKGCAFKDQCFDEFAFPEQTIELVME